MKEIKIGIIAGTPIDTKMGIEYMQEEGFKTVGRYISKTPQEQSNLQILNPDRLHNITISKIKECKKEGAEGVIIYCNSLSTALDIEIIKTKTSFNIVTPLDIYKRLAKDYTTLGLIAANNQSAAGIEATMQEVNPKLNIIGTGILPIVTAIEESIPPKKIVDNLGLKKITQGFVDLGVQALIIGCTHFPYFTTELDETLEIEIINPALEMANLIKDLITTKIDN